MQVPFPGTRTDRLSVLVIVPCLNEGPVLRQTLVELLSLNLGVVVVDDGSSPPMRDFCRGLPVHLLRHSINLGQGAALQTGMDYALGQGADYLIHFDADGQHDPASIPRALEILRRGDTAVVLGSRFLNAEHTRAVPWLKRCILRGGIAVSWVFSGLWLTDTHNGFRGFTRAAAQQIHLTENGFSHATEILEQIHRAGLRYRELPTLVRYTDYSQRKGQSVTNSVNLIVDLLLHKIFR